MRTHRRPMLPIPHYTWNIASSEPSKHRAPSYCSHSHSFRRKYVFRHIHLQHAHARNHATTQHTHTQLKQCYRGSRWRVFSLHIVVFIIIIIIIYSLGPRMASLSICARKLFRKRMHTHTVNKNPFTVFRRARIVRTEKQCVAWTMRIYRLKHIWRFAAGFSRWFDFHLQIYRRIDVDWKCWKRYSLWMQLVGGPFRALFTWIFWYDTVAIVAVFCTKNIRTRQAAIDLAKLNIYLRVLIPRCADCRFTRFLFQLLALGVSISDYVHRMFG